MRPSLIAKVTLGNLGNPLSTSVKQISRTVRSSSCANLNALLFIYFFRELIGSLDFQAVSPRGGGGVLSIFVLPGCAVFQGIVFAYLF